MSDGGTSDFYFWGGGPNFCNFSTLKILISRYAFFQTNLFYDFLWKMDPNLLDCKIQIINWNFQNSSQFTNNNNLVEASYQFVCTSDLFYYWMGDFCTIFFRLKNRFWLIQTSKELCFMMKQMDRNICYSFFLFFCNCQISIVGFQ
jgi:hypothetical protein